MGLDWVLHRHRPRKGKEAAFKKAQAQLNRLSEAGADEKELALAREALAKVSHTPMEDIGAPRVGIDAKATAWFLKHRYAPEVEHAKSTGAPVKSKEDALKEVHGAYVAELAKKKGGLAGGSFLVSDLDFGAGILDSCTDVIADASEAWVDHSAKEAAAFAKKLKQALTRVKTPEAVRKARVAKRVKSQGPLAGAIAASGSYDDRVWVRAARRGTMSQQDQIATVKGIVAWLEFWSKLGYGFKAWS